MIRINLVSEGKRAVASKPTIGGMLASNSGNLAQWLFFGLVGVAVLGVVIWWAVLNNKISSKQEEVAIAQKEVDELAPIIKEVEEFKAKKAELQRKVSVINNLKARQKGPVRVMDEVSKALPELLWLTRMQVQATKIIVSGQAFNTNAVANFIENLDRVPEFQEPILQDANSGRGSGIYTFNVSFTYSFAPPRKEEEAAVSG
jgi:Tfp pilus assembly protein PilN